MGLLVGCGRECYSMRTQISCCGAAFETEAAVVVLGRVVSVAVFGTAEETEVAVVVICRTVAIM